MGNEKGMKGIYTFHRVTVFCTVCNGICFIVIGVSGTIAICLNTPTA